ncbi:hypothetical protein [Comamonas sp.]|uniref:hypothetical protein n=1 Tax=Comamonas sp. TaxID=34028 RepID=UPI0025882071|nr:hypothetical protein [Comamonas sp.]
MNHPPGRLTLPRVPLTDRAFNYTCSAATNVQATWQREKRLQEQEAIEQQRAAATAQPLLPGIAPQPSNARPRAGMGAVIALPLL